MIENIKVRVGLFVATVLIGLAWVMPNFVEFGEDAWWLSLIHI